MKFCVCACVGFEGSRCVMFGNIRICYFEAIIGSEMVTCFTPMYVPKIYHRTENRGRESNVNVGGLNVP
jgi:hypothetical protein